jgi:hypothetical protein
MTILDPATMPSGDLQQTLRSLLDSQKILYEQLLRSNQPDSVPLRPPSPVVSEGQVAPEDVVSLVDSVDTTISSISRPASPLIQIRDQSLDLIAAGPRNASFFFEDRLFRLSVSLHWNVERCSFHLPRLLGRRRALSNSRSHIRARIRHCPTSPCSPHRASGRHHRD